MQVVPEMYGTSEGGFFCREGGRVDDDLKIVRQAAYNLGRQEGAMDDMRDDGRLLSWEGDKVDGFAEGEQVLDMDGVREGGVLGPDSLPGLAHE